MSIIIYIAVMAGVTYLIRMIPFTLFRKKIKSTFFRGFLYYIPYAVLSAMTIPAIFYSTGNVTTSVIGTVVAVTLAYFKFPLIVVALAASAAAFVFQNLLYSYRKEQGGFYQEQASLPEQKQAEGLFREQRLRRPPQRTFRK